MVHEDGEIKMTDDEIKITDDDIKIMDTRVKNICEILQDKEATYKINRNELEDIIMKTVRIHYLMDRLISNKLGEHNKVLLKIIRTLSTKRGKLTVAGFTIFVGVTISVISSVLNSLL